MPKAIPAGPPETRFWFPWAEGPVSRESVDVAFHGLIHGTYPPLFWILSEILSGENVIIAYRNVKATINIT